MSRSRDSQRKKVYDAENAVFDKSKSEGLSVAEAQALVDKLWAAKYVQRKYPWTRVRPVPRVTDGRGRRKACYEPGYHHRIKLPLWSRSRWIVLHEAAHALTDGQGAGHGWQFCECYLYLVRLYLGRAQEERLKVEFKARRVRFREPRRRNLTPEQREAARNRMLAFHANRG